MKTLHRSAAHGVALFCASIIACTPVYAKEEFVPDVAADKQPIDVHQLRITSTAEVGVVRFTIEPHDYVGPITLNHSCIHPANLTFDAYELVSKRINQYESQWTFNLQSLQKTFATEMEKVGYPKYDPDLSLFGATVGTDADFRIGVTFTNLQFNKCSDRFLLDTQGSAFIEAIIEVFSPQTQQVVYASVVKASYKLDGFHGLTDRDFNQRLIRQMIANLLAEPDFVAVFSPRAEKTKQVEALPAVMPAGAAPSN